MIIRDFIRVVPPGPLACVKAHIHPILYTTQPGAESSGECFAHDRGRVSTAESDAKVVPRDDARGVAGRPPRAIRRRRGGRWRGGRILRGLAKEVEKLVEERLARQRHARRRREGGPAPGLAGHGGRRGPPHPKL